MGMLEQTWNMIWGQGIFIAQRDQSPILYSYFLGGIAFSFFLGIANFAIITARRNIRHLTIGRIFRTELRVLIRNELLPLYALWLAFATPATMLPFSMPKAGSSWLFLPAPQTYAVLATLIHGYLAIYGLGVVVGWLIQLNTPNRSRIDNLCILLGYFGIIYGWEVQHWPELFVVVAECLLLWRIADLLTTLIIGPRTFSSSSMTLNQVRLVLGIFWPLLLSGFLLIALWHEIDFYIINIIAIFFVFTQIDQWYIICRGQSKFGRSVGLSLLVAGLTLLAASGALLAVTHNHGMTYSIWLEAGMAAAAFLIFFPLTEVVRKEQKTTRTDTAFGQVIAILQGVGMPTLPPERPIVDSNPPAADKSSSNQKPTNPINDQILNLMDQDARVKLGVSLYQKAQQEADEEYRALRFQAGSVFLVLAILYHLIAGNQDILSALNGNLIAIVFGVLSLFVGIIALIASNSDAARAVLVLLLLFTLMLIAADIVMNYAPLANGPITQTNLAPIMLWNNEHYLLVTLHNAVQELLVLFSLGQIFYLLVILFAVVKRQQEHEPVPILMNERLRQ
jgi:hypothetical protein